MTSGFSPADLWAAWSGAGAPGGFAPPSFGGPLPTELGLAQRLANLRTAINPQLLQQLSAFDQTRLLNAVQQLETLEAGGMTQSGGFTASQRIANLQSSIGRMLATAEQNLLARQAAAQEARIAAQQARAAIARQRAAQSAKGAGKLIGGGGLTLVLAAVLLIVVVGLVLNKQQQDILDRARALPDAVEPSDVFDGFVGPPAASACIEDELLEDGLIWTEQGWRAPLTLPEPTLYGDSSEGGLEGNVAFYRMVVNAWKQKLEGRLEEATAAAEARCGTSTSGGGGSGSVCNEQLSSVTVWKPTDGFADSFVLLDASGELPPTVWEWERGKVSSFENSDLRFDFLVARLSGEPGAQVCVGYRFIAFETAEARLTDLGVAEETIRAINSGCYWELGVETEDGLKAGDTTSENARTGAIGTDGNIDLRFAEVACGAGSGAKTFLELQISAEAGADVSPR